MRKESDQTPGIQCRAHPIPLYESDNYIYLCSWFAIVTMVVVMSLGQSTTGPLYDNPIV